MREYEPLMPRPEISPLSPESSGEKKESKTRKKIRGVIPSLESTDKQPERVGEQPPSAQQAAEKLISSLLGDEANEADAADSKEAEETSKAEAPAETTEATIDLTNSNTETVTQLHEVREAGQATVAEEVEGETEDSAKLEMSDSDGPEASPGDVHVEAVPEAPDPAPADKLEMPSPSARGSGSGGRGTPPPSSPDGSGAGEAGGDEPPVSTESAEPDPQAEVQHREQAEGGQGPTRAERSSERDINAEVHQAEKRGLRRGTLVGGLAGYAFGSHRRGKHDRAQFHDQHQENLSQTEALQRKLAEQQYEIDDISRLAAETNKPTPEAREPLLGSLLSKPEKAPASLEKPKKEEEQAAAEAAQSAFFDRDRAFTSRSQVAAEANPKIERDTEAVDALRPELHPEQLRETPEQQTEEKWQKIEASPELPRERSFEHGEILHGEQSTTSLEGGGATSGGPRPVASGQFGTVNLPAQPIARTVAGARAQAAKEAKRAALRARLELAIAMSIVLVLVLWMILHRLGR